VFREIYLPPFKRLAFQLGRGPEAAFVGEVIRLLLQTALANGGFDEAWYLATYPDVGAELTRGALPSAFDHFCRYGFLEERRPRMFVVDEPWYCRQYGDVKAGICAGVLGGATAHYNEFGWSEGRAPTPVLLPQVVRWNSLLLGTF
jgi:hypothetical protein